MKLSYNTFISKVHAPPELALHSSRWHRRVPHISSPFDHFWQ